MTFDAGLKADRFLGYFQEPDSDLLASCHNSGQGSLEMKSLDIFQSVLSAPTSRARRDFEVVFCFHA